MTTDHRAEAELYKTIVEDAGDAIIYADREGRIQLWNRGAEAIFGYSRDEAIGQTLDLIIPQKLQQRHWDGYRSVMETGTTRYGSELLKVPAVKKGGQRLSVEFTVTLVSDGEGHPAGVAAILRDVTEQWTRERELLERIRQLEAKATPG